MSFNLEKHTEQESMVTNHTSNKGVMFVSQTDAYSRGICICNIEDPYV